MLDKTYNPDIVEGRIYAAWESAGAFQAGSGSGASGASGESFTIVIPPPNVTGSLHMGHALNNALQDILVRQKRMAGSDVLWQVGTDHAGIATQMVVERQLEAEGLTRHDLGREAFIERVWKWKAESGGTITGQLRRLGASCDWSRERFTMDEGLSAAVRKVFVDLFKQGLIYRDKRLVNWDPLLHTAISDLEVEQREMNGHLWHFKYPIEGQEGRFITVATTRPETMLGDTAVAVHPDDDRYKDLIGKNVVLPITGRVIPIVADDYADPEKGSGAVKITPAHDFNDFEVGRRHDLPLINVLDRNACMEKTDAVPDHYRGLDRYECRDALVKEMDTLGLLEKIEDNLMQVPYGDRSGVVIEPWLTDQWFANAGEMAKEAIAAVEDGRTKFVPKNWENTYFDWMRNIQPWCISRQIWWGHQVPAWYGPDGEIFVELTEEEALAAAEKVYGKKTELRRDEDVLDTWFSSALWPFSTLGWPEKTPEVARYYPTNVLVTGFDIIFFWVARMMMAGLHFMKEIPFHTVYVHALVRDEKGQKMSKSKGNVIDPLTIIDQYGADALRFTLTAMAAQGRDVKLSESRIEGYRNFVTKIWNAARFAEMNECAIDPAFNPSKCTLTVNRWIVSKVKEVEADIAAALEAYRFNDAANAVYHFVWGTYCDWYLEFTKPIINGDDAAAGAETRAATAWARDQILLLLHPFMPFVTEELWAQTETRKGFLMLQRWPRYGDDLANDVANKEMDWVVRMVSTIRGVRAEMNVPPGAKIPLHLMDASPEVISWLKKNKALLTTLARLSDATVLAGTIPSGSVQAVLDETTLILPIAGVIDVDAEAARLNKEIKKLDGEITKYTKKLSNEGFLAKAPADVVAEQRERLADMIASREKIAEALERISAL